jgi:hypothetical protein
VPTVILPLTLPVITGLVPHDATDAGGGLSQKFTPYATALEPVRETAVVPFVDIDQFPPIIVVPEAAGPDIASFKNWN